MYVYVHFLFKMLVLAGPRLRAPWQGIARQGCLRPEQRAPGTTPPIPLASSVLDQHLTPIDSSPYSPPYNTISSNPIVSIIHIRARNTIPSNPIVSIFHIRARIPYPIALYTIYKRISDPFYSNPHPGTYPLSYSLTYYIQKDNPF